MRELTLKIRNQKPGEVCAFRELQYDELTFAGELQRLFSSLPEDIKPKICLISLQVKIKVYEATLSAQESDIKVTEAK